MKKLTQKEEEVMAILWRLERAFVNDILNEMEEPKPPYNTVSSIIRKLEAEGHIGYEAFGKTHRYYPILKKEDYRAEVLDHMVDNFFDRSPAALLSYFVKKEKLDNEEINRLLEAIRKRDEENQ